MFGKQLVPFSVFEFQIWGKVQFKVYLVWRKCRRFLRVDESNNAYSVENYLYFSISFVVITPNIHYTKLNKISFIILKWNELPLNLDIFLIIKNRWELGFRNYFPFKRVSSAALSLTAGSIVVKCSPTFVGLQVQIFRQYLINFV